MDKTSQKVKKDPNRQEAARKGRENYMNKLKESILNDASKAGKNSSNAGNDTTDATICATTSATGAANAPTDATTKSNDAYIYSVGKVAFLAIGPFVFFGYKKKSFQTANKGQANEEQQQHFKPPKQCYMF